MPLILLFFWFWNSISVVSLVPCKGDWTSEDVNFPSAESHMFVSAEVTAIGYRQSVSLKEHCTEIPHCYLTKHS